MRKLKASNAGGARRMSEFYRSSAAIHDSMLVDLIFIATVKLNYGSNEGKKASFEQSASAAFSRH
jgi:hypothetical protein